MIKREEATRQRRALIIAAAAECFIKKGFHQASVRDIARTAGISLGNLYNHFASKNDLVTEFAIIEADLIRRLTARVELEEDPQSALERFAMEYLAMAGEPATAALTMELTAEALRNPEIERQFSGNRTALTRVLCNILERGRKQGLFGSRLPMPDQSNAILDIIEGIAFRSALSGGEVSPDMSRMLTQTIGKIVSGP